MDKAYWDRKRLERMFVGRKEHRRNTIINYRNLVSYSDQIKGNLVDLGELHNKLVKRLCEIPTSLKGA